MNPQFSLQIWIGHNLRIIYTQNSVCINSKMTELDTGGCFWRPIDIWALAQSSLNLNMECLVSKYSPGHHLAIYETKMEASLRSGISQILIGLHGQPPKKVTLLQGTQLWWARKRRSELERASWSWRILPAPAPALTFSTENLIFILWLLKK